MSKKILVIEDDPFLVKFYKAKFKQKAKKEHKDLYIYDVVGKHGRWLQYFLEQENAGPYYFMKGGARKYISDLRKVFAVSH